MSNRLGMALGDACARFGQAPALVGRDAALSYRGLHERAQEAADALRAAGLAPAEPVHVRVSNRPSDLAALLGTWSAGGVAVPIHRTTPDAVAERVRDRTRARLQLDLEGTPLSRLAGTPPPARPLLEDAAFVIFTSGSTGTPKGVVVSHDAFAGKLEQIDRLLRFAPGERTLLVLNLTFSFGLWVSLLTLLRGGTLAMRPRFEPQAFARDLVDKRIDRAAVVPTMMRALLADASAPQALDAVARAGRLRQLLIGGESLGRGLADTLRERLAGTGLVDIYGLTETATCDFFAFPEDALHHPGCIGRASPGVEFRIVTGDARPAAPGTVGELQIRSPFLMRGYLDEPALTAAAMVDGWLRTGDLARTVDADGAVVELMGRSKELIVRAGNKVTPGEVEQALGAHPDVAAAMAVGVPDAVMGERIHALVVPRAGVALDAARLGAFLEPRLERFKRPDVYYLAAELPLGRTGKADRGRLRAMIAAGELAPVAIGPQAVESAGPQACPADSTRHPSFPNASSRPSWPS